VFSLCFLCVFFVFLLCCGVTSFSCLSSLCEDFVFFVNKREEKKNVRADNSRLFSALLYNSRLFSALL